MEGGARGEGGVAGAGLARHSTLEKKAERMLGHVSTGKEQCAVVALLSKLEAIVLEVDTGSGQEAMSMG